MTVSIQHIRHATSIINMNGKRILIDPMLSDEKKLSPVPFTRNFRRNPLTPLPVSIQLFKDMDGVLLTHRHFDHWDKKAISILNKSMPIFCQQEDLKSLQSSGFNNTIPISDSVDWEGINIKRIKGQHESGLTRKLLGPVSGYILNTTHEGSIYIVGDCILTPSIEKVLRDHAPSITIINTGEAEMIWGSVITMTRNDIIRIAELPNSKILAVHLDTINHCKLSRNQLINFLKEHEFDNSILIPKDGELIYFDVNNA